jgi:hypothetical protein
VRRSYAADSQNGKGEGHVEERRDSEERMTDFRAKVCVNSSPSHLLHWSKSVSVIILFSKPVCSHVHRGQQLLPTYCPVAFTLTYHPFLSTAHECAYSRPHCTPLYLSLPRRFLASALIFSRHRGHRCCGLLSQTYPARTNLMALCWCFDVAVSVG